MVEAISNTIQWQIVHSTGNVYSPRTGHTVCINNNVIYLFGGADLEQRTNELYSFDPFTNKWTQISPLNTLRQNDQPAPRSGAHSISFENSIFFFGGYTRKGGIYFNDLTEFKTLQNKWVNLNPQNSPQPRTDHSFVRHFNQFYVYGGRDETHIFSDMHVYQIGTNTWQNVESQRIEPNSSEHQALLQRNAIPDQFDLLPEPKIRFGHTAVINKHYMYILGGWDGQMTLNDLSIFDLNLHIWLTPRNMHGNIEGRYRHTACATSNAMYVFGGINLALKRFNDIHEYNFETQAWTRRISLDITPTSRTFHQAVVLNDQWLFVFGGFDGMKRNDLYRARVEKPITGQTIAQQSQRSVQSAGVENGNSAVGSNTAQQLSLMDLDQAEQQLPIGTIGSSEEELKNTYPEQYFKQMKVNQWVKVNSQGQVFTPRTGHECIFADGNIYLFAGTDDDERLNDLYQYSIRKNRWSKIDPVGDRPTQRSGARGIAYMDGLFFFGGYQRKRGHYFNDLFYFDLDQKTWSGLTTQGEPPSPRTDHTVVLYDGSMYVFAGYDGRARFNDLWRCTLKGQKYKWKQEQTAGTQPLNRFGHAAVVCNNSMFVIGGWNGHDTMDDIYQYSFPSKLWFEIRRLKGVRPKPRYRHTAVLLSNTIFVFGGVDTNQQRFNDLFSYEVETRKWSSIDTTGTRPQERTFHKAVIFNNVMYVVGGFDGSRLNDLYHIALPGSLDIDEIQQSVQRFRPPSSSASGFMRTVPSDISVNSGSMTDFKWEDNAFLRKKVITLTKQVDELTNLLKQEEETFDDCNICFTREINTVFLDCSHRVMCQSCATWTILNKPANEPIAKCPICRVQIKRVIRTYNV